MFVASRPISIANSPVTSRRSAAWVMQHMLCCPAWCWELDCGIHVVAHIAPTCCGTHARRYMCNSSTGAHVRSSCAHELEGATPLAHNWESAVLSEALVAVLGIRRVTQRRHCSGVNVGCAGGASAILTCGACSRLACVLLREIRGNIQSNICRQAMHERACVATCSQVRSWAGLVFVRWAHLVVWRRNVLAGGLVGLIGPCLVQTHRTQQCILCDEWCW